MPFVGDSGALCQHQFTPNPQGGRGWGLRVDRCRHIAAPRTPTSTPKFKLKPSNRTQFLSPGNLAKPQLRSTTIFGIATSGILVVKVGLSLPTGPFCPGPGHPVSLSMSTNPKKSRHSRRLPSQWNMIPVQEDDESGDLIELLNPDDDEAQSTAKLPDVLSILPIKNTVLFPGVVIPITVGRQKSIGLVKKAYKGDRIIGVVSQRNAAEEPVADDLYQVGTMAHILKMMVLPDGSTTIIIQGKRKFQITEYLGDDPYLTAQVDYLADQFPKPDKKEGKALISSLKDVAGKILRLNPEIPQEAQIALDNIESPGFLTHFLSSNITAPVEEKQKLLETLDGPARANLLLEHMLKDLQMLELKNEIQNRVSTDIDQQQRDYFIRQQIKALQDELGYDSTEAEIEKLRAKGDAKNWPEAVAKQFTKEVDKLARINPMSAEFPVSMNYVELLVELPWGTYTKDQFDLIRAKKVLDADHYGLQKVKDRIIEYLAVLKLKQNMRAPILCLLGPPGVGKTSLGKSIAKALGRKYVRMSLGGVRDEAEIRGHRKTYIGAMPGRIISNIKKIGASNPVFILDEIDKVGSDFRGDPSSALLEVLDPEQNSTFIDNYLEVEYDLSRVLFVATTNSLDTIHPALRDRMEIIEINGYALEEKLQIARRHLLPKQKEEHGLKIADFKIDDKGLVQVIEDYTRESGVRKLEQKLGELCRKIAKAKASDEPFPKNVKSVDVERYLGAADFDKELYQNQALAGVTIGLAWTQVGGEILFIESSLSRGNGKLTLSGQLGDVMKESAVAAMSYLKSHAEDFDLDYRIFNHYDVHIHVPAGAVPKDGPSAGITILTSLASVFTQRRVQDRLAMTGEITLRGVVLPVGGIKEKVLAAKRAGIESIILSEKNRKDVDQMQAPELAGLTMHYVRTIEDVLAIALLPEKVTRPIQFVFPEEKEKLMVVGN